jgi:hypothetical protein|tara:strand:- start:218 stop:544 length:327 start_codon:yes stop_codon:yes gene_type:complete
VLLEAQSGLSPNKPIADFFKLIVWQEELFSCFEGKPTALTFGRFATANGSLHPVNELYLKSPMPAVRIAVSTVTPDANSSSIWRNFPNISSSENRFLVINTSQLDSFL